MDDRDARRPRTEAESEGLSPVRAFILLGTVVAAIAAVGVTAFRDAEPAEPRPTTAPSPDHGLTEAEAIAEFERLNEIRLDAYRGRDVTLLYQAIAPNSPLLRRGENEIRQLLKQDVLVRSRFVTEAVVVDLNTPSEVIVRETEADYPKFLNESGVVVTADDTARRRVIEWTLRRVGSQWRIFDSKLISERRIT